jgi:hypothetical protein
MTNINDQQISISKEPDLGVAVLALADLAGELDAVVGGVGDAHARQALVAVGGDVDGRAGFGALHDNAVVARQDGQHVLVRLARDEDETLDTAWDVARAQVHVAHVCVLRNTVDQDHLTMTAWV